jgi:LuxR family maltose regulon positive regulatory protein
VIKRERLFRMLDEGIQKPLIWVSGPAGSGKTSLVSNYLQERSYPHLWYRLDELDEDIATFFNYIRLAADNAAPGNLPTPPVFNSTQFQGVTAFARQFFEALCSRLKPPFALVFDDYHELGTNWTIRNIFHKALEAIPEGVCCIFISRSQPEAEFARFASYGRIYAIDWDDLRFTLDEVRQLTQREGRMEMKDEQIKEVIQKTDGWAAGLLMAVQSSRRDSISGAFMEKLSGEGLFDYFSSEIFERLDPAVRSFLLSTAFLPEVNSVNAERLTGLKNSGRILSDLYRNNFFTEKNDSKVEVYSYHPLFQDFLRAYARKALPLAMIEKIRTGAAQIMEEEGRLEEAIDLYIEQEKWEKAVGLFFLYAQDALIHGRAGSFEKRLSRLPQAIREGSPYLSYFLGMCRLPADSRESRSHFEHAFRRLEAAGDMAGALLAWSGVVESIFIELGDMHRMDAWVQWLDDHFGSEEVFFSPEIRTMVVQAMLGVLSLRQSNHPRADFWVAQAEELVEKDMEMNSRVFLAARLYYYYSIMEENSRSNLIFRRLEPVIDPGRLQILTHLWWRVLVLDNTRYTAWQTREGSESYFANLRQALLFSQDLGITVFDELNLAFGAHVALVVRDIATFDEMLGKLKNLLTDDNLLTNNTYHLYLGLKLFFLGDYAAVREQGNIGLRLSGKIGSPINLYRSHVLLFCAHIGLKSPKAAEKHYLQIRRIAKTIPHLRHDGIHLLMQAYLLQKTGDLKKAKKILAAGFKKVKEENTIHSAFWFPSVLTDLCVSALDGEIEVSYVQDVIRHARLLPESAATVSEKWPFPIKIFSLGKFEMEINGKLLDFEGRVPQRPLALLKTVIACGRAEVSLEQIADALWPDAEGDAAHSAFTTTLGRLRKLLGYEEAVHVRHGKVSLDPQLCWVDVHRFLYLLEKLDVVYHQCDLQSAKKDATLSDPSLQDHLIGLTNNALALYQGPFLGDEPTHAQTLGMRERLRARHIRLILTSGKYLEKTDKWRSAAELYLRGLETDDLVEEFYERLMICYRQMGLKADVIAVFKRCSKTLKDAFDVKPSDQLRRIYQSLIQ